MANHVFCMADACTASIVQPEASSSSTARPLCAVCNHRYSIYTCPGCSTRTCSLPCSSTHKARNACTGERNKAAFVPMNLYGWGTMMNDYVFLEDLGRKVGEWGNEIANGGFGKGNTDAGRGRGANGRERGRGRGGGWTGGGMSKRDVLKMQLEFRDIDIDLLPIGMERRKINQSCWDFKNKTALLTIEFKFHCPPDPLLPPSQEPIFVLLTHRNNIETPLLSLIQAHIMERIKSKKNVALPAWVKSLVCPHPDDPDSFTSPQCLMTAQINSLLSFGSRTKLVYYKLDHTQKLSVLLRNTHFVEYPTVEVWEEFRGAVVDTQGAVTHHVEEERKPKRRKLDLRAGKLAISGLLGGYGSDEEAEEEQVTAVDDHNVLSMLGGYMCSDDDEEEAGAADPGSGLDADAEGEDDNDLELDPAVLLELMRQVQGSKGRSEEDAVDWGDSDEEFE